MKYATIEQELKRKHVIEQLEKFNYTNVSDKSYDELKQILAKLRYLNTENNGWF